MIIYFSKMFFGKINKFGSLFVLQMYKEKDNNNTIYKKR